MHTEYGINDCRRERKHNEVSRMTHTLRNRSAEEIDAILDASEKPDSSTDNLYLLHILARDSRISVRRRAAEVLKYNLENDFNRINSLIQLLARDSSPVIQNAAARRLRDFIALCESDDRKKLLREWSMSEDHRIRKTLEMATCERELM